MKEITFNDLLRRSERKTRFLPFFVDELKELYSPAMGYPADEDPIGAFIYESKHGIISGGKWLIAALDFYKVFDEFRDELQSIIIHKIYAQNEPKDAAEIAEAIRTRKDRDYWYEIGAALVSFTDELAYALAKRAAIKRGKTRELEDISKKYF